MDNNMTTTPLDEGEQTQTRTVRLAIIGAIIGGCFMAVITASFWFRSNISGFYARYFPSPTPTIAPSRTPIPTQTHPPNLTATQEAWVIPSQLPTIGTVEEARQALDSNITNLEDYVINFPDMPDINQPGDIYIFEISLNSPDSLLWSYGWCAKTSELLKDDFTHMQLKFVINTVTVPEDKLTTNDAQRSDSGFCREYVALVTKWTKGEHQLEVYVTFTQDTDDGWNLYPAGTHMYKYFVTVQP